MEKMLRDSCAIIQNQDFLYDKVMTILAVQPL